MDLLAAGNVGGFHHLVYVCRTEVLAGVAILLHASRIADIGVVDDQMCGLVFFVFGAGVI